MGEGSVGLGAGLVEAVSTKGRKTGCSPAPSAAAELNPARIRSMIKAFHERLMELSIAPGSIRKHSLLVLDLPIMEENKVLTYE